MEPAEVRRLLVGRKPRSSPDEDHRAVPRGRGVLDVREGAPFRYLRAPAPSRREVPSKGGRMITDIIIALVEKEIRLLVAQARAAEVV